jgi:hypothetical protein
METQMKSLIAAATVSFAVFALNAPAQAGCLKGALVGGIAGHFVGHGGVGAAAGCAYGASRSHKADRQNPSNGDMTTGRSGSVNTAR